MWGFEGLLGQFFMLMGGGTGGLILPSYQRYPKGSKDLKDFKEFKSVQRAQETKLPEYWNTGSSQPLLVG